MRSASPTCRCRGSVAEPFSNADEAKLTPTERRDLILAVLTMQRIISETWGRWATVQEIEELLTGQRSL